MRLDRFLAKLPHWNNHTARLALIERRVSVDNLIVNDPLHEVREFSQVMVDADIVQMGKSARYFMLHKPPGCVSATRDEQHPTVLDLLHEPDQDQLHIGGRLDFNTSGLMLITNDGQWSRRLTQPTTRLPKVYYVETEQTITQAYVEIFHAGLYFAYENLTTLPAQLTVFSSHSARLTIYEGRYHQVKRMFGHFNNKVLKLHRESMGGLQLDSRLTPGQYRPLTAAEIALI